MVGVAQGVLARKRFIGEPAIMNQDTTVVLQQAQLVKRLCASLGVAAHPTQRVRGQCMQPVQPPGHAQSRFVSIDHRRIHAGLPYALYCGL